jgi:hypothetical protein
MNIKKNIIKIIWLFIFIYIFIHIFYINYNVDTFYENITLQSNLNLIKSFSKICSSLKNGIITKTTANILNNLLVKGNINSSNMNINSITNTSNNIDTINTVNTNIIKSDKNVLNKININNSEWEKEHNGDDKSYIISDNKNYKSLMIVGNNLKNNIRNIQLYDNVTINGNLKVNGMIFFK